MSQPKTAAQLNRVTSQVCTEIFVTPHLRRVRDVLSRATTVLQREPQLHKDLAALLPEFQQLSALLAGSSNGVVKIEHEVTFELDATPVRVVLL